MSTKEKYLSEAKMRETPSKKLSLQIADGAVTTGKIAKGAVTSDKLGNDVSGTLDYLDESLQAVEENKVDKSILYNTIYTQGQLKNQNYNSGSQDPIVSASTIVTDGGGYKKPNTGIPMDDLSQNVRNAINTGGSGSNVEVIELNGYMSSTSWQGFHSSQDLCSDVISAYQSGKQVVLTYYTTNIHVTIPIQFPYAQSATGTVIYALPWSGSGVALSLNGSSISSASNYLYFISGDGNGNIYTQIYILSENIK